MLNIKDIKKYKDMITEESEFLIRCTFQYVFVDNTECFQPYSVFSTSKDDIYTSIKNAQIAMDIVLNNNTFLSKLEIMNLYTMETKDIFIFKDGTWHILNEIKRGG